MGPNISAHENVNYLDCLATFDYPKDKLNVLLINRDPLHKLEVTINLSNPDFKPQSIWVLKAKHPLAANTINNPDRVRLTEVKISKHMEEVSKMTLEPASIYQVEFSRK